MKIKKENWKIIYVQFIVIKSFFLSFFLKYAEDGKTKPNQTITKLIFVSYIFGVNTPFLYSFSYGPYFAYFLCLFKAQKNERRQFFSLSMDEWTLSAVGALNDLLSTSFSRVIFQKKNPRLIIANLGENVQKQSIEDWKNSAN